MKNLIQIKVENDQQLVSARELYKGLDIKKDLAFGLVKTLRSLRKIKILRVYPKVRSLKVVMEQLENMTITS